MGNGACAISDAKRLRLAFPPSLKTGTDRWEKGRVREEMERDNGQRGTTKINLVD